MSKKIERRFTAELRAATDSQGDEMALVGYAAKFNKQSQDLGGFRETIMPGAFARSIREGADVKFLQNHDPSLIMGRTKNKTLKLEEDGEGLRFRVVLPNTQAARDLYSLVKRGDMDQCSFAFTAKDQSWEENVRDENGDLYSSRKLMDVDLMDCSAVTWPAYLDTQVSARQLWPDGAPEEVRSKLEARGSENQPGKLESIDTPQPWDPDAKEDWWNAFADAYDSLMKKGGRGYAIKQAIAKAIAAANQAVSPVTEVKPEVQGQGKNPTSVPHDVVDTDGDEDGPDWELKYASVVGELRYSEGTYEDAIQDVQCALKEKYGATTSSNMWPGCPKYNIVETYADHVLTINYDDGCYYSIVYKYDSSAKEGNEVTLIGDPIKMEQQYVPSDRALLLAEARVYKSTSEVPAYVPKDKKKQWLNVWNSAYKKSLKDGKEKSEAESSAFAQANSVTEASPKGWTKAKDGSWKKRNDYVSDPSSEGYDPDDDEYDPDWADENDRSADPEGERAKKEGKKTKRVAGKDLTSDKFAWVGDPQDPSTWKLPIHDEEHARNALARFNQTKGIPADKKEGIYKKIVAAAKKFGIEVTEEDSLRCAMDHQIAKQVMNEVDKETLQTAAEQLRQGLQDRMRVIEISLD